MTTKSTETSSEQLGRAIKLASNLHCGQTDKSGEPYILHPLAVMQKCAPIHEVMMVAILHDVVEDCDFSVAQLRSLRFPEIVCTGVQAMTRHVIENGVLVCRTAHEGDKKEVYADFIRRVAKHPIGCIVKCKDIDHNLSPERLNKLDQDEIEFMVKRYRRAQGELYRYFATACFKLYGGLI